MLRELFFPRSKPGTEASQASTSTAIWLWFSLSILFAAALGCLILYKVFSQPYITNDDARQHIFWMHRFVDPTLFPNDFIADYFQAVAPIGYKALYQGLAAIGIHPLLANKLLPPILLLISAALSFGVCWQIFPVPIAAFFASTLLSQNLLLTDDVLSGTPRAFAYPLLLGFLFFWLRRSILLTVMSVTLLGIFYPQVMLIACGCLILNLGRWQNGKLTWATRSAVRLSLIGLAVGGGLLVYYATSNIGSFEPTVTLAQAKTMPEFMKGGRSSFFSIPSDFYLVNSRAGLFPRYYRFLQPPLLLLGLAFPFLARQPRRYPLVEKLGEGTGHLLRLLLTSLGLWGLAHLLLFRLHLPSRYTQYSLRILLAIAAGITLALLWERLQRWGATRSPQRQKLKQVFVGLTCILFLFYPLAAIVKESNPAFKGIMQTLPNFKVGEYDKLYQFLAQQPKTGAIASLLEEADNIPTFAARSVFVAREYAIPYHLGYYNQFEAKTQALLAAQYSQDRELVRDFIQRNDIRWWVIDNHSFNPQLLKRDRRQNWLRFYQPTYSNLLQALEAGQQPVVLAASKACTVFEQTIVKTVDDTSGESTLKVLDANCIAEQ
ncbi:MAG TPA: hypothetical protein IGS53_14580 [Leptolyngbyaceae cyanobacterium M33_DOE_097]|uniref:Glycosyltransferase RgtA/B/C/D-like domain-containing protein n=1 Tax=Oscillatoriales cyanobacterium SpSt-418 TaxID=2282169 RepID=A0A7C3KB17_9CYAN|nr:hypothetical protein [Leptolyngbyaceae cyanobacterium M33_DOE_097]